VVVASATKWIPPENSILPTETKGVTRHLCCPETLESARQTLRKTILIVDRTTKVLERETIVTLSMRQGETNRSLSQCPLHSSRATHLFVAPLDRNSGWIALHGIAPAWLHSTPSGRQNLFQMGGNEIGGGWCCMAILSLHRAHKATVHTCTTENGRVPTLYFHLVGRPGARLSNLQ